MSAVTIQSNGHVDVDWQDQVPCPVCKEGISQLRATSPREDMCYIEDGKLIYEPEFNYQDDDETEYYCPACGILLFTREEGAERFLLSRSWEPDVLPMPLT